MLEWLEFAAKFEGFNAEQKSLLDETIDADLVATARDVEALAATPYSGREKQLRIPEHRDRPFRTNVTEHSART